MIETNFKHTDTGVIPYDWEVKTLGEVGYLQNGFAYNSRTFGDMGYTVIRISDIKDGKIVLDDAIKSITKAPDAFIVKKGDFLIAMSGATTGKIGLYFNEFPSYINQRVGNIICVEADSGFVRYSFNSICFAEYLKTIITAGAQPNISKKQIEEFAFATPPTLAEQEKIANALSKIDQLINDLGALIEKKKAIKQGTMQDLLTAKRRLKGFTREWTSKQIIEIVGKIKRGQSLQSKDYKKGDIPVVAGGKQYAGFHNVANHHGRTITISGSGANAGYVSFHANPIFATDCSVIDDKGNFDLLFIYYVLQQRQNDIYKLQSGGAQPHIYPKNIEDIVSIFPPTLAEQNAIANILSSMDTEITNLEQKRNKYIVIKQGMMQNLLTGKIRLI